MKTYSGGTFGGDRPTQDGSVFDARHVWWKECEDGEDEFVSQARARSLYETVRGLEDSQRVAHEQYLWNARLYSNRELANFDWGHGVFNTTSLAPVSLLGENLVLSVVDTIAAVVGKNRTKATPVPTGASFKTHRLARKLDRWIQGEFDRHDVYRKLLGVLHHGLVMGHGVLKVVPGRDDDGPCVEVVFPDNFLVDQAESVATRGRPRHAYERHCLPVEQVEERYGLDPGSLRASASGWLDYRAPGRGWVVVCEGYRAGCEDRPGRHFVSTEDQVLLDEPWEHDWLPYLWFHPNLPLGGAFHWPSVVEQVLPYQVRLNEINEVIRDAQDLVARPRLLVAEGSRVNPVDLDNLIGRVIKYTGQTPVPLEWQAVNGELYQERDHQVRACFEQFGLGQLVSQGRLPGGARLDSSAALQEATTITDDRLATLITRWEEFHLDVARAMIRAQRASKGPGKTTWHSGGKARAEVIKWKDVDLDDEAFVLTLGAASVFSLTPAARRDKLENWLAKGLITPDQFWDLESHPDVETASSLMRAPSDDIRRVVEDLEDGKVVVPDPMQDLVNGVRTVTFAYLRLRADYDDVPTDVLDNFVKWVSLARAIMRQGTQTPDNQGLGTAPQTAPAPPPGGMPTPQPGVPNPPIMMG